LNIPSLINVEVLKISKFKIPSWIFQAEKMLNIQWRTTNVEVVRFQNSKFQVEYSKFNKCWSCKNSSSKVCWISNEEQRMLKLRRFQNSKFQVEYSKFKRILNIQWRTTNVEVVKISKLKIPSWKFQVQKMLNIQWRTTNVEAVKIWKLNIPSWIFQVQKNVEYPMKNNECWSCKDFKIENSKLNIPSSKNVEVLKTSISKECWISNEEQRMLKL
jgi:hypothetical protein